MAGNQQTWLVWHGMTGKLMLEVRHVPAFTSKQTVAVVLANFGYWPVQWDDLESAVKETEYMQWATVLMSPGGVVQQWKEGSVRHIEWREMWVEEQEAAKKHSVQKTQQ